MKLQLCSKQLVDEAEGKNQGQKDATLNHHTGDFQSWKNHFSLSASSASVFVVVVGAFSSMVLVPDSYTGLNHKSSSVVVTILPEISRSCLLRG